METIVLWALVVVGPGVNIGYNYYPTQDACNEAIKIAQTYKPTGAVSFMCVKNYLPDPHHHD